MPKIIQNIREQLLEETKRQITQHGYAQTTIRSVASACGVSVGTVYNYFPSKEVLIGSCVYEDWKVHLAYIESLPKDNAYALLGGIYEALRNFAKEYAPVFLREDAAAEVSDFPQRHKMLRAQLSASLLPLCEKAKMENPAFGAEFVAESLIVWSMEGIPFAQIYPLLQKLIKTN